MNPCFVNKINPYIGLIRSIKVRTDYYSDTEDQTVASLTLLDRIILDYSFYRRTPFSLNVNEPLLSDYLIDKESLEINSMFSPFRYISHINLKWGASIVNMEFLEIFKTLKLNLKSLDISAEDKIQLEKLTNPIFYKAGVENINCYFQNINLLSDKTVENLDEIRAKNIFVYQEELSQCLLQFSHLFSKENLKSNVNLISKVSERYSFELNFENTVFKIFKSQDTTKYKYEIKMQVNYITTHPMSKWSKLF